MFSLLFSTREVPALPIVQDRSHTFNVYKRVPNQPENYLLTYTALFSSLMY